MNHATGDRILEEDDIATDIMPAVLHCVWIEGRGERRLADQDSLWPGPTRPGSRSEHHLAFRSWRVQETEPAVAVVQVAASPSGHDAHRAAVEDCTRVALLPELHDCRLINERLLLPEWVAHRAVQKRAGVHIAEACVHPVGLDGLLPRLDLSGRRSRGPV